MHQCRVNESRKSLLCVCDQEAFRFILLVILSGGDNFSQNMYPSYAWCSLGTEARKCFKYLSSVICKGPIALFLKKAFIYLVTYSKDKMRVQGRGEKQTRMCIHTYTQRRRTFFHSLVHLPNGAATVRSGPGWSHEPGSSSWSPPGMVGI